MQENDKVYVLHEEIIKFLNQKYSMFKLTGSDAMQTSCRQLCSIVNPGTWSALQQLRLLLLALSVSMYEYKHSMSMMSQPVHSISHAKMQRSLYVRPR